MRKKLWKRAASTLLALTVVLGSTPVGVSAENTELDTSALDMLSGAEISYGEPVPVETMEESSAEEKIIYVEDDPDAEPDGEESVLDYIAAGEGTGGSVSFFGNSELYATVYGYVVDEEGKGLSNVNVALYDNSYKQILASTYTDAGGYWETDAAVQGNEYHLRFHSPFYSFPEDGLTCIASGETVEAGTAVGTGILAPDTAATPSEDFTYTQLNATYASITGYLGDDTRVVIPETIDGFIVQSIGASAFSGNTTVESVVLPFYLTTIGSSAFHGCTALNYVGFNNELTTIGSSAFYGCTALETVVLPNSVLEIQNHAFYQCVSLKNISMPMSLLGIYGYAFAGCTALERVVIPNSVVGIGYRAFYQDSALNKVVLPEQWDKCLAYNVGASSYYGGIFEDCTSLTSVSVPEIIETLPACAFADCESLEEIVLPEYLVTVGDYAFKNCVGLTEFVLPADVETLGVSAFQGCTNLAEISLPDGLITIGNFAFQNCTALTKVTLPDTVEKIGYRVFQNNTGLTSINIPLKWKQCTVYNNYHYGHIFEGCTALTSVTVPEGMTILPAYAFQGCTSLTRISLPGTLLEIGAYAFQSCVGFESITLPESLQTIGNNAFEGCGSLKSIHFPGGMRVLGNFAFASCPAMTSITMDEGMESLGAFAFGSCTGLKTAQLADSITALGYRLFEKDTALTSVNIPESWSSCPVYNNYHYGYIFADCTALTSVTVPETVAALPALAFQGCNKLESIALPSGLSALPDYAFDGCTSLKSIDIPGGVETIGAYAFRNCTGLSTLTFPDKVRTLNGWALQGCTGLSSVKLSASLTSVGPYAFGGCTGLTALTLPDTVTSIGFCAFQNCTRLAEFQMSAGWNSCPVYNNYHYGKLFEGCSALTKLALPEGIASIPRNAFQNSPSLRTVVLPESVQSIQQQAFENCSVLRGIWIDSGVSGIVDNAFTNCANLTIHGVAGSYAQTFADSHDIPFSTMPLEGDGTTVTISGVVKDNAGKVMSDVAVSVFDVTDLYVFGTAQTDENGSWSVAGLTAGHDYRVRYHSALADFGETVVLNALFADTSLTAAAQKVYAAGEETPASDFTYAATSGNFIEITGYTGSDTQLVIPSEIDGYTVDGINAAAFKLNTTLTSVILPDTLTVIEDEAFTDCDALEYVGFGRNVQTIGVNAFGGCDALKEVELSNGVVTIGNFAFQYCSVLESVSMPDTVENIGYRVFLGDTVLTSINIPLNWKNCTVYNNYYYGKIFEGCTALTSVTVPEGMVTLPANAFGECANLQQISLPSTLRNIGAYAFRVCTGIESITLPEGLQTIGNNAFEGCGSLKSIHFPGGMRVLGNFAFASCPAMTSVTMDEGMESLGAFAFGSCTGLKTAQLADSVTALGYRLFEKDTALTSVNIPESWSSCPVYNNYYYGHIFVDCTALTSVTVPEAVAALPALAFQGCNKLESIVLPSGLTALSDYAFDGCTSLKSIDIPDGVETIGAYAFRNCTGLSTLTFPDKVQTLNGWALQGCSGLSSVKLSASLTSIGPYAFGGCTGLTALTMPDTVTSIGFCAFQNCTRLAEFQMSAGWNSCPVYNNYHYGKLFEGCSSLTRLELPEGLSVIARNAFQNSPSLRTVILPASLAEIGTAAFADCAKLETLWIGANTVRIAADALNNCGVLTIHGYTGTYAETYAKEHSIPFVGGELDEYFMGLSGRVVDGNGAGVAGISVGIYCVDGLVSAAQCVTDAQGNWNFEEAEQGQTYAIRFHSPYYTFDQQQLKTVMSNSSAVLPTVVARKLDVSPVETPAGDFTYAVTSGNFIEITGYTGSDTRLVIPAEIDGYTVDGINVGVFKNNATLTSVILPDTLTVIEDEAFTDCDALEYVGFGRNVQTIGVNAFGGCDALKEVELSNGVVTIGNFAFQYCSVLESVSMPDTVENIGYRVFLGDTVLTSINIPLSWKNCTVYNNYYYGKIFEGCTALTSVTVPEGMVTLPANAFLGCVNLMQVSLPSTLINIGAYAFRSCAGIESVTLPESLQTIGNNAFEGCGSLKSIHFPGGMRVLGNFAFASCPAITSVTMDEGMESLGAYAFGSCTGLKSAQLADSVTALGYRLFEKDAALTSVNIPESWSSCPVYNNYYYGYIFVDCTALTSVTVPKGIAQLPTFAFQGCNNLEQIYLPDDLPALPDYAFDGCTALKGLDIPDAVESIGAYAFRNCPNIASLVLPAGVHTLGGWALQNCTGLGKIELSVDLQTIGAYAFSGCTALNALEMHDQVTSIGYMAFNGCTKLSDVTLSAGWTSCPVYNNYHYGKIFNGCTALTRLDIPEGAVTIPAYAFQGNADLITVTLPETITSVDKYAFDGCTSLGAVDLGNVRTIGEYAFRNCTTLEDVVLSNDLRTVGKHAFSGCSAMTFENLPPKISSIGEYGFNSTALKDITIPMGVNSLNQYTFANCPDLTNVTIRRTVTSIHSKTFENSPNVFFYCYNGSAAHDFAVANGIPYELLPEPAPNGSELDTGKYVPLEGTDADGNAVSAKLYVYEYGTLKSLENVEYSYEMGTLSMELEGYYPVEIEDCTLEMGKKVKVAMVPENTESYIAAVHCEGKDALANSMIFGVEEEVVSFRVYSSVSANLVEEYQLLQDGIVIARSENGRFNLDTQRVALEKNISARIVHALEGTCGKLKTGVVVAEDPMERDVELELGEKINFDVPDDVPIIGGGEFELDFSVLPIYVYRKGNTLRAGIGVKQDLLENESTFLNFKKFIEDQDEALEKGLGAFKDVLSQKKAVALPGEVEADLEAYGYLEGTWDKTGELSDVSGNIMIKVSGSFKKEWQTMVYVVPVVVKFKIEAGMEDIVKLGLDVENGQLYFGGEMEFTLPKVTLSGGVGIAYVADVSAYGSGKNVVEFSVSTSQREHLTATLKGEAGISAKALFVSYKKPLWKGSWQYYNSGATTYSGVSASRAWSMALLDPDNYVADRTYMPRQSEWMGGQNVSLFAAADEGLGTSQTLQTSVFYSAAPQMVVTDSGLKMLVWTGDMPGRTTGNHTAAMYSIYDSAAGTWSEPQVVEDDGTADYSVRAATDGENIYLVWMDSARNDLTEDDDLAELSAANGITAAVYDPETGFAVQNLDSGIRSAMLPQVAVVDGTACIAWVENSADDPLTLTGTNTISYASYDGENWNMDSYISCDQPVVSLALGGINDRAAVAYGVDGDSDLTTDADVELYGNYLTSAPQLLTDNSVMEQNPQFAQVGGEDVLAWYADGALYASSGFGSTSELIPAGDISHNFKIVNWNGEDVLICAVGQDSSSEIQMSVMGDGEIGMPVALYSGGNYVTSFAVAEEGGSLLIPYTAVYANITEESVHETTNLCLLSVNDAYDICLDGVMAAETEVQDGVDLPVDITVTNTGTLPVSGLKVTAKIGSSTKLNTTVDVDLEPGESAEITVDLPLEANVAERTAYAFTVKAVDGTEWNTGDNAASLVVGYADLQLSAETVQSGDSEQIMITVENVGCIDTQAVLRAYTDSGEYLKEFYLGDIDALGSETVHLDSKVLPAMGKGEQNLRFEVFALTEERYFSNNEAWVNLSGATPALSMTLTVNGTEYTVDTELSGACHAYAAVYDANGMMLAGSEVQRAASEAKIVMNITVSELPEEHTVKVFFLDEMLKPLSGVITVNAN